MKLLVVIQELFRKTGLSKVITNVQINISIFLPVADLANRSLEEIKGEIEQFVVSICNSSLQEIVRCCCKASQL